MKNLTLNNRINRGETMKEYIKSFDNSSKLVKILLAIPFLDILWVVYRLFKSIEKNNTIGIVLGILLLVIGIPWLWVLDIITILLTDKVLWID